MRQVSTHDIGIVVLDYIATLCFKVLCHKGIYCSLIWLFWSDCGVLIVNLMGFVEISFIE